MNLSGNPFDYVVAFLGGLFVSLTPCIYPLIPISAGYIGITSGNSRAKGFMLGFIYVTGIAATYAFLGLLASLTGHLFGAVSNHPFTQITVGIIVVIFGLSLFDLWHFSFGNNLKPHLPAQNYLSAFILGLSSGFIVSPCLTPVLGSILAYLATKKDIFYGMSLLVTFAYGMGAVLILIATSSALLMNLPKAGRWMGYLKKILAIIIIFMGCYLIYAGIRRIA